MATNYQPTFGKTTIAPELILKAWAKACWDFGRSGSYFKKFMGHSRESIIQIQEDLSRGKGTSIEVSLLMPLNGAGVIEDKELEGKEERMNYRSCTVYLSRIRNAVRFKQQKNELTCGILCAKVKLLRTHTARRSASQSISAILNVPACFVKHKGAFLL